MPQSRKIGAAAIAVLGWVVATDATAAGRGRRARSARSALAKATGSAPAANKASHTDPRAMHASVTPVHAAAVPSVLFATEKRAYLNRGRLDGLAAGQTLQLLRGGRAVGTCTVETVSAHRASCTGARPRAGDGLRMPAHQAAKKSVAPSPELPSIDDDPTLRARAAVVGQASYQKVDFNGAHAVTRRARVSISPQLTIWRNSPDAGGDYTLEELDATLQAYDVGGTGLDFSLAFTAMRWGGNTAGRFRPTAQSQFYLWQAEVARRHTDASTVVAVGRIWPWYAPGLAMLDGLQIGRRNQSETAEGGLYVGFVPQELSTLPSATSWAAGTYGTLTQIGSRDEAFRLAREQVRVGVSSEPGTGLVTDADLLAQAWIGIWSLAVGGRGYLAPSVTSGPVLDRASLDLAALPSPRVGAGLHLRYFGAPLPSTALLTGVVPSTKGMLSAAADAHMDAAAWLGLAAFGSFNQDRESGQAFGAAGGELRFSRVADGLSFGGEYETGWMSGVLGYSQLVARAGQRIHMLARLSFSVTELKKTESLPNVDEVGGYLHAEGVLASWLRLRLWSLVRVPVLVENALPTELNYGLVFGASLAGAN